MLHFLIGCALFVWIVIAVTNFVRGERAIREPERIRKAVHRATRRAAIANDKANILAARRARGETGFWGQRI